MAARSEGKDSRKIIVWCRVKQGQIRGDFLGTDRGRGNVVFGQNGQKS